MIPVIDLARVAPATLATLRSDLDAAQNLADVLVWARTLTPPVPTPVVVTQDEYTHDVLIPWRDGLLLAFDVT
jgi:hypothetical protein